MPGRETPAVLFLIAAISIAGLPPLSGFLAKAALLQGVPEAYTAPVWAAVLGSSLLVIMGLARGGIRLFWRVPAIDPQAPRPRKAPTRRIELLAACLLLLYGIGMTVFAAPLMRHADAIASDLLTPAGYVDEVRATTPEIRNP
jgi:multicomponent K+:H+ antiporter subunit D